MTNRFMISVAALALIAGTGFANAQGTGMSQEGASAAARACSSVAVVRPRRLRTSQMNRRRSQGAA